MYEEEEKAPSEKEKQENEEEQKASRDDLVPKIKCVRESLTLTKKLRLFFGVYFFACIFLIVLFAANEWFGMAATLMLAGVSVFFAKRENDYIKHLSKTYGV